MSRRSIFLLAATVVLLYFSIILFILSPLHGAKTVYYSGNYMNDLGFRQVLSVKWCKTLHWRSPPLPNAVALVSFPGSGNTWLRYLLQQVTGIVTGSIYMDHGLLHHGFPAENYTDGSVLVVKTHEAPPLEANKFSSAILLVRNPKHALLADFNRLHKGHVGVAPKSAYHVISKSNKKSEWVNYVYTKLNLWESMHNQWLMRFQGPLHIVFYELLVKDTRRTLLGILHFLNHTISEEDLDCALANKEGIYRRKNKLQNFHPFSPEMHSRIEVVKIRVFDMLMDYIKRHNDTNISKAEL